jgi:hypothetical protein
MRFVNLSHDRDSAALRCAHDSTVEEAHALGIETDDLEAAMAISIMAAIEDGQYDVEQLSDGRFTRSIGRGFLHRPTGPITQQFFNRR